jgi:hypothetical protein
VPAGSVVVVIPKKVSDNALVAVPPPLSVNLTVNAAVPGAEAVPLMTPVAAARPKPAGKLPTDIDHVTGGTAPDAARVAEYGVPAMEPGNVAVVITGLELTLIDRACTSDWPCESCALTVNEAVPALAGLPPMLPPLVSVSPEGNAPIDTDQVYGDFPPVAASGCE